MPSGEFEFKDEYDFWNVPPPSLRVNPWLRSFVAMRQVIVDSAKFDLPRSRLSSPNWPNHLDVAEASLSSPYGTVCHCPVLS